MTTATHQQNGQHWGNANGCGSRKAVSVVFVDVFAEVGHPLSHASTGPIYDLAVRFQRPDSVVSAVGDCNVEASAIRVPARATPTAHYPGRSSTLVYRGAAMVGLAGRIVFRSATDGNALAEAAFS